MPNMLDDLSMSFAKDGVSALSRVLQQLDQCSLACTTVTCSTLRHAVLAAMRKVSVRCSAPETLGSFIALLEAHSSSLTNLTEIGLTGDSDQNDEEADTDLHALPCPQLRQLHLMDFTVQLAATEESPGVLHGCTGLQLLNLFHCDVTDNGAEAAAAIAALPDLQHLRLEASHSLQGGLLAQLQFPVTLTHLNLQYHPAPQAYVTTADDVIQLTQLSGLVNLQHLQLVGLPRSGLPGGLPSELVKLTYLKIRYKSGCDAAKQLQHLSRLTALRQLSVKCTDKLDLQGLQGMSHLTQLELNSIYMQLDKLVPRLTALQTLSLQGFVKKPDLKVLGSLTQLQALSFKSQASDNGSAVLGGTLAAVSKLTLLTELRFEILPSEEGYTAAIQAAAFTALTASTKLCSLDLCLLTENTPPGWQLWAPGIKYQQMRRINLACDWPHAAVRLSQQNLQQLCSCCPSLESLVFNMCSDPPPTALQPLLQLSALTRLEVYRVGAKATKPVIDTAAQLTGLKHLEVLGLNCIELQHPRLLQLTKLTRLEKLALKGGFDMESYADGMTFRNQARWFSPPDVWMQLLCHLWALGIDGH